MLKILVIHGKGGCDFWRTWQPCESMRKQGLADVRYLEPAHMTAREVGEGLRWADIVHVRGLFGTEGLTTLRHYQSLGIKVTVDYDDLHFNVSPFNPAYRNFGTEEVEVREPKSGEVKTLWKDGQDGFSIKSNKVKWQAYVKILQEADLVTTTTIYLKDAMSQISGRSGNISVLPNAIDLEQWKPLDVRDKFNGPHDKFRFGWAVSASHGEDWLMAKPFLVEFLNRHKDAKFVVMGDTHIDIKKALPEGQVEWYPFSSLWEYHYALRMPMLGLDCAIAPLADIEFNKCKSPLKFAEYTAFGWPVVAQNMEPYSSHMVNGETGLLASSSESWVNALELMYSDEGLRAKLHFNAVRFVREIFNLKKVAHDWKAVYTNLAQGESVLNVKHPIIA